VRDQNEWPQSVQKRAWRKIIVPQPGQLLCVLAMSKPHSPQKRPPDDGVRQLGHADADAWLSRCAAEFCFDSVCSRLFSRQGTQVPSRGLQQSPHTACLHSSQVQYKVSACCMASASALSLAPRDPISAKLAVVRLAFCVLPNKNMNRLNTPAI
jgi:hypothetical protein